MVLFLSRHREVLASAIDVYMHIVTKRSKRRIVRIA